MTGQAQVSYARYQTPEFHGPSLSRLAYIRIGNLALRISLIIQYVVALYIHNLNQRNTGPIISDIGLGQFLGLRNAAFDTCRWMMD
jgi:hypothetical protein